MEKYSKEESDIIKQKIMENIIAGIQMPIISSNTKITHPEMLLDILFSILVMTCREFLTKILIHGGNEIHSKRVLKDFFNTVRSEVEKEINNFNKEKAASNAH